MSPDSSNQKPAERRKRFKKLLEDVERADSKVLHLFPPLDFNATVFGPQAKKGLRTALRVLLVAAEDGYVNENELSKYGVGGDSRHKMLRRLLDLGLLVRSEETSEKGGKKFVHHLSGKGLLLCAAFSRIFKSGLYVSLIKCVANKSLANVTLFLYHRPISAGKNRLLEVLHSASDISLNFHLLSEESVADRLLQAEESVSMDRGEMLVFEHLPEIIDMLSAASDEVVDALLLQIAQFVKSARSQPHIAKAAVTFLGQLRQLFRSTDFQILLRTPDGFTRFVEIGCEVFQSQVGNLQTDDERAEVLLRNGKRVFEEFRRRLREESLSRIAEMKTKTLGQAV